MRKCAGGRGGEVWACRHVASAPSEITRFENHGDEGPRVVCRVSNKLVQPQTPPCKCLSTAIAMEVMILTDRVGALFFFANS